MSNDTARFIEFGPERCQKFNQSRFTIYQNGRVPHALKRSHLIPPDEIVHLYTLIIRPDGTFEMLVDNRSMKNGTFVDDFTPPLFETPTIDDPDDHKPDDWVDAVLIPDPLQVKPKEWDDSAPMQIPDPKQATAPPGWLFDESSQIPDAKAKKPADWDEDRMGEWKPRLVGNPKCLSAPGCGPYKPKMIRNMKYRGVWRPFLIRNPAYVGEWKPRQIPNPNYHGQSLEFVMPPITAIGFDMWTDQKDFAFTNIVFATDEKAIRKWNDEDFVIRQRKQIRGMKINYNWITTDLPDDVPEGGLIGYIEFFWRCIQRKWVKVRNKPVVIILSASFLFVFLPIVFICCQLYRPDPFVHMKED